MKLLGEIHGWPLRESRRKERGAGRVRFLEGDIMHVHRESVLLGGCPSSSVMAWLLLRLNPARYQRVGQRKCLNANNGHGFLWTDLKCTQKARKLLEPWPWTVLPQRAPVCRPQLDPWSSFPGLQQRALCCAWGRDAANCMGECFRFWHQPKSRWSC